MFGFGSNRGRRVRNDTFSPNRVRNALLAGAGMYTFAAFALTAASFWLHIHASPGHL